MLDWLDGDEGGDLLNKQGQGLHVVMPPSTSPSLLAAVNRMKSGSFPKAQFHTWSALNQDHAMQGAKMAFGKPMAFSHRLALAFKPRTVSASLR